MITIGAKSKLALALAESLDNSYIYLLPEELSNEPLVVHKDEYLLDGDLFNRSVGVAVLAANVIESTNTVKLDFVETYYKGPKYFEEYVSYVPLSIDVESVSGDIWQDTLLTSPALWMFGESYVSTLHNSVTHINFVFPQGLALKGLDLNSNDASRVKLEYLDGLGSWVTIDLTQGINTFAPTVSDGWRIRTVSGSAFTIYQFTPIVDETTLPANMLDFIEIKQGLVLTRVGYNTWESGISAMAVPANTFGEGGVLQLNTLEFKYTDHPTMVKFEVKFEELGNDTI